MRSLLILTIFFIVSNGVNAQYCPPLSGKFGQINPFHITAGYGVTQVFGDIGENNVLGSASSIAFDYQFKKGLFLGIEGQFGSIKSEIKNSTNPIPSHNNYISVGVRILLHPFLYFSPQRQSGSMSRYLLESMYIGLGTSYVINNYEYVFRHPLNFKLYGPISGYSASGDPIFKDKSSTLVFPSMNLGSALPLYNKNGENILSLVVNAQFNFGQNDLLDGYVPYVSTGIIEDTANDMFNLYSLGLRYSF